MRCGRRGCSTRARRRAPRRCAASGPRAATRRGGCAGHATPDAPQFLTPASGVRQCVYLSGRQGGFYNLSRRWLVAHGYPPGPIALTEFLHLAALPGKARTSMMQQQLLIANADCTRPPQGKVLGLELVGAFKRRYMAALLAQGLTIAAAYGNTLNGAPCAVQDSSHQRLLNGMRRLRRCGLVRRAAAARARVHLRAARGRGRHARRARLGDAPGGAGGRAAAGVAANPVHQPALVRAGRASRRPACKWPEQRGPAQSRARCGRRPRSG